MTPVQPALLGLSVLAAWVLLGSSGARSESQTPRGTIAVASSADFRTIFLISPASGQVAKVRAPDALLGLEVDLSPDGSRIAFGGTKGIWTMTRTGRRARRVLRVSPLDAFVPGCVVWSPDGRQLAFTRGGVLFTIPASGGRARKVTGPRIYAPDWSPLGSRIVFVRNPSLRTGSGVIQSVRLDGKDVRTIVRGARPDVSPDGTKIAFSRRDGIYVVPLRGGRMTRIVARRDHPEWSPDGRYIAFTREETRCGHAGCEARVFVMPVDGGMERAIGPTVFAIDSLSWSK